MLQPFEREEESCLPLVYDVFAVLGLPHGTRIRSYPMSDSVEFHHCEGEVCRSVVVRILEDGFELSSISVIMEDASYVNWADGVISCEGYKSISGSLLDGVALCISIFSLRLREGLPSSVLESRDISAHQLANAHSVLRGEYLVRG